MKKRISVAIITSLLLVFSAVASADPVTLVFSCELKEGKTKDDAMAINAKWLKWARATAGSDKITSSFVSAVVGELDSFMWVDTYPDITTWGKIADADSAELDAQFNAVANCSSNRMYRGEETVPAK